MLIDLVAEPVAALSPATRVRIGAAEIPADSPHEILVNKLCALLGRSEIRDLIDIKALLESGLDLGRALSDAPRKDGGFSPLVLAWLLRSLPLEVLGRAAGVDAQSIDELQSFKASLIERLVTDSLPEAEAGGIRPR